MRLRRHLLSKCIPKYFILETRGISSILLRISSCSSRSFSLYDNGIIPHLDLFRLMLFLEHQFSTVCIAYLAVLMLWTMRARSSTK